MFALLAHRTPAVDLTCLKAGQHQTTSVPMPSVERVQQELASANCPDDFFGKDGIFARLFADTLEQMLQAELTAHLGYEPHAPEGRNSGNSRNGKRSRKLRTSNGDATIARHPGATGVRDP